jgi:thiol-disulfide isomerase/thioredoxin
MMKRTKSWIRLGAVAALGLLLAVPAGAGPAPADTPPASPAPEFLKVGETVPPFEATGVDGAVKAIKYPKGTTTVLLFFLSGCPHCHKMLPEWNRAFERKPAGLEVVGVLMDREPPGFFAVTPVSFPVVRAPSRDFGRIYKVERVPLTVRVAPGGKVEGIAQGIIDAISLGELFRP